MRIRLYIDEDAMAKDLVKALRANGLDVVSALDAGLEGQDDERHLGYAAAHGLVLYSFNGKDFQPLHYRFLQHNLSHAGIVLAPQRRYSIGEQMRRLKKLVDTLSGEEMKDRIEFLSAWS